MPATTEKLEANVTTPMDLFSQAIELECPMFQRRYVWGKAELDRLWDDIDAIVDGEDPSRFLGALVLKTHESGISVRPARIWIIDGQQRLTTLYLYLTAIASIAESLHDDEFAQEIAKEYLFIQRRDYRDKPKIVPTHCIELRRFLRPPRDWRKCTRLGTQIRFWNVPRRWPSGLLHGGQSLQTFC